MLDLATKSRLAAFASHLTLSALIVSAVLALVLLAWYPGVLAEAQGVWQIALILAGVDVILGPLITLIIFNPAKSRRELLVDFSVIAALQLAALGYGVSTVFEARPAYMVFNVDRFTVVTASELDAASLERAITKGVSPPAWDGPLIVSARLPDDIEARNALTFSAAVEGLDLPQLPEWFLSYEAEKAAIIRCSRPLKELLELNDISSEQWQVLLAGGGAGEEALRYLPLRAKTRDGVVVVDAATAAVKEILLLQPRWEICQGS